jgi:hypothetical protein
VANRTDSPLRVTLFSEPATRSADGVYGFGGTVTAKGASVTVGANHLVLAPHASAVVPVVVRAGTSRGKRYAVVMATAGAIKEGSLSVVPRLAVLVEIQPAHGRAEGELVGGHRPRRRSQRRQGHAGRPGDQGEANSQGLDSAHQLSSRVSVSWPW